MTISATNMTCQDFDEEVIRFSHGASCGFLASVLSMFLSLIVILLPGIPARWKLLAAWFLPVAGAALAVFSAMLCRKAPRSATGLAYWFGIVLIWLSATFDVGITILRSPDLAREANPVFRLLLDHGCAVHCVYTYMFFTVAGSCVVASLGWMAVFRHRGPWLRSSFAVAPSSIAQFCKAAMGGNALTWRQFIIPLHWSERPQCYPAALTLAALLVVTITLAHVRCGLEWVGLIPLVRWWILRPEVVLGIATLLVWLAFCYRRFRTSPAAPAAAGGAK